MAPLSLLLLHVLAGKALACGMCATAAADQILPPIFLWCTIAVGWFLLTAAAVSWFRVPSAHIRPGILKSALVAMAILVFGAALFGMGLLLLLAIPPAIVAASCSQGRLKTSAPQGFVRVVRVLSSIAVLAMAIATIECHRIRRTRAPEAFILKWGDAGPSLAMIRSWKAEGPANLPRYRYLIEQAPARRFVVLAEAAEGLAEVGEPTIDIPLMEAAKSRCGSDHYCADGLEEALKKIRQRQPTTLAPSPKPHPGRTHTQTPSPSSPQK